MILDVTRAAVAAVLVGVAPGWAFAACLYPSTDLFKGLAYASALSMTLTPLVALALARLSGGGITLPVSVLSAQIVLAAGLVLYLRLGPAKGPDGPVLTPPAPPSGYTLALLVPGLGLALAPLLGLPNIPGAALAVSLLVVCAGVAYGLGPRDTADPKGASAGERWSFDRAVTRHAVLAAVLAAVLLRAYLGPIRHDWPFVRGVDHYGHAVIADLLLSEGGYESYAVYPPGFHVLTALVSRVSGLSPLEVFSALGPALLLLPALALYALADRLWGWSYGVAAAGASGLILGSSYDYNSDSMYPNLVAAQFFLPLAVAALVGLYARPSRRAGVSLAVLGSSVVLYHQVAGMYLVLLLLGVTALVLPRLLLRESETGASLFVSLSLMAVLAALYAWETYDLPSLMLRFLTGDSDGGAAGDAVGMAVGTQIPKDLGNLLDTLSAPVLWLGLLGALMLLAGALRREDGVRQGSSRTTLVLWGLVMFVGSRTSLDGFPHRFERDLGVPMALFAALAFVTLLRALTRGGALRLGGSGAASAARSPVARLLAPIVVLGAVALVGVQAVGNVREAAGTSFQLVMTPEIAAAGEWLERHNTGGNIMVSPHLNQVPSRAMLALSGYSGLQSYEPVQLRNPRDLPPSGPGPPEDVLRVLRDPAGERTRILLERHDVRYVVLYKNYPGRFTADFWRLFEGRPALYREVFENGDVLIVEPRPGV